MRPHQTFAGVWHNRLARLLVIGLLTSSASVVAQDESQPLPQTNTVADANIPIDRLQVKLRPLMKEELEIELRGWIDALRAKINKVGETEIAVKGWWKARMVNRPEPGCSNCELKNRR